MRTYPTNSPEALARLVCMAILSDGRLDSREVELIEGSSLSRDLGLERGAFLQILLETCRDLIDESELASVTLLENARLLRLAKDITDPALQRKVCAAILLVCKFDGKLSYGERHLLRVLTDRWELEIETLAEAA